VSPALFYATSTLQNAIYAFNPDTGSATKIKVGTKPYSIGYNYQTGGVLTINSTSQTASLVDSQSFKTRATLGISSQSQFSIAVDNVTNTAVIVDQNNNRVLFLAIPK
jgi:DNA-binding beta-propeller fold protein YncE